jgi:predicted DNA-binding transcriptional regulator AlpA
MSTELVDIHYVTNRLSISRQTVYRMRKSGEMPRPVPLKRSMLRWLKAEIDAWICADCPCYKVWCLQWEELCNANV